MLKYIHLWLVFEKNLKLPGFCLDSLPPKKISKTSRINREKVKNGSLTNFTIYN